MVNPGKGYGWVLSDGWSKVRTYLHTQHCQSNSPKKTNIDSRLFCDSLHKSFQSYYFDRDDVALKGFAKFFKQSSDEEREHGEKLMKLQNTRGGRIVLQDIKVQLFELPMKNSHQQILTIRFTESENDTDIFLSIHIFQKVSSSKFERNFKKAYYWSKQNNL